MMLEQKFIVGIGEALWDMLPTEKKLGGAPLNFAYHVSQFGLPVQMVSAVGKDDLGKEILDQLTALKIPATCPQVDYPTGQSLVTLDDSGEAQYEIVQPVAWDYIPYEEDLFHLALQTKVVCFGTLAQRNEISRGTIQEFVKAIPDGPDVYKVFDCNLRQNFYSRELIYQSMIISNVVKVNEEELNLIRSFLDLENIGIPGFCRTLVANYNLKLLIVTCGTKGSYIYTPSEWMFLPTPKVQVKDTVGAGDAFVAALMAALVQGKTLREAHQKAVDVSAYICTQVGAMPVLPKELVQA